MKQFTLQNNNVAQFSQTSLTHITNTHTHMCNTGQACPQKCAKDKASSRQKIADEMKP